MHVTSPLACAREGQHELLVLEERAVTNREVDAHQILEEHATGADRQVPDLGVPHLPGRESDCLARCFQGRVRVVLPEPVEHGCVRELDRVPRARRSEAPPVEDDERDELRHAEATCAAARQIASKDVGSSEAPPTRAPSTSGWTSSDDAFCGLTEPP